MVFVVNTRSKKLLCLILNLEICKHMLRLTDIMLWYATDLLGDKVEMFWVIVFAELFVNKAQTKLMLRTNAQK